MSWSGMSVPVRGIDLIIVIMQEVRDVAMEHSIIFLLRFILLLGLLITTLTLFSSLLSLELLSLLDSLLDDLHGLVTHLVLEWTMLIIVEVRMHTLRLVVLWGKVSVLIDVTWVSVHVVFVFEVNWLMLWVVSSVSSSLPVFIGSLMSQVFWQSSMSLMVSLGVCGVSVLLVIIWLGVFVMS